MSSRADPPGDRRPPARAPRAAGRRGRAGPARARPPARPGVELVPDGEPVVVHARPEEHRELRELVAERRGRGVVLVTGPPPADAADPADRSASTIARGSAAACVAEAIAESAVIWRLDRPEALLGGRGGADAAADLSAARASTGRSPWPGGWRERLRPTRVRPNAVTLASAALMLAAAAIVAAGRGWLGGGRWRRPALALALVLDTADGHLARLQGTTSAFGRWLDQVLDELGDMALHAAIAWAAFARDGRPVWLVLGHGLRMGKYLFLVQSRLGDELERARTAPRRRAAAVAASPRRTAAVARLTAVRPADRPCRRALAPLDRAGGARPARRRAGRLCDLLPGAGPGRRGPEGGAPCLSPAISVLILARNEAQNLADCLAAVSWADEVIVVVDRGQPRRDLDDRPARGRPRRGPDVRRLRQPAQRRAGAGHGRLGLRGRRRRAGHARAGRRDPPRHRRPRHAASRLSRADPERDPGPAVRAFPGRSTTARCGCSAAIGPMGRPGARDGRPRGIRRAAPRRSCGTGRSRHVRRSSTRSTATRRSKPQGLAGAGSAVRTSDLPLRPAWTSSSSTSASRVPRRPRGLHVLPVLGRVGRRCGPGSTAS